jgi:predicted RNase H-like HicB family nuclease
VDLLSYAVVLEPEEEGGFSVHVPALPEAHTQGETIAEALANAREVVRLCVAARRDLGDEIPPTDDGAIVARVSVSPEPIRGSAFPSLADSANDRPSGSASSPKASFG